MKLFGTHRFPLVLSLILLGALSSFLSDEEKLKYTQAPTLTGDDKEEQTLLVAQDTLSGDSLFLVQTTKEIPLYYFKNISTNVCFDHECRLLKVRVYWNITGRYLGFELSKGEFLSKREHEPFSATEYERLNDLLADPTLPLGGISFEALIEKPEVDVANTKDSVDAVSRASTPTVSTMVVKGAAYTTYTLWNIVHGPNGDLVSKLTEKRLSAELINLILHSPDISDRVWALNRIHPHTTLTPKLRATLLAMISSDDFYLSYSAINAIHPAHLHADTLQNALFFLYPEADHSIQRLMIEKLMEAPYLTSDLLIASRKLLSNLNGKQLGDILKLYQKHSIEDLETRKEVANILNNENQFISRQAYQFLKESNLSDKEIEKLKRDK